MNPRPLFKWKRLRSLRVKIFLLFALFTLAVFSLSAALYIRQTVWLYRDRASERSKLLGTVLATSVRLPLYSGDREELARVAGQYLSYPGVKRVTILSDGEVAARAGTAPLGEYDLAQPVQVVSGFPAQAQQAVGRVEVVMDGSDLRARIRSVVAGAACTAAGFWVFALAGSYLLVRRITRSLGPLTRGLEEIAKGNYAFRIPDSAPCADELGAAGLDVNKVAAILQKREEEDRLHRQREIKALELEKGVMMAKLIQTNRMTSLGLLVSGIAHEINTPMGAIRLAGEQIGRIWKGVVPILDGIERKEGNFIIAGADYSLVRTEVAESAEVLVRSAGKVERVVKDLRRFHSGENVLSQEVDLQQAAAEAIAVIRAHGRHGAVAIRNEVPARLPRVTGNPQLLEQVLVNLLLNGIQAIPAGRRGTVTVGAEADPEEGGVRLWIADDGEGIPVEQLSRLVEPFFSTRLDKGGSGLGLYITNYLVAEHKGSLHFDSALGEGTTVTVRLPLSQ